MGKLNCWSASLSLAVSLSLPLAITSQTAYAQELVSSDANGQLLVEPNILSSVYKLEDMTPDGRYVLFSGRESCNLYRKDRVSGELLLVLENTLTEGAGYSWCNGAGISADGNLVAASPTQYVAEPQIIAIGTDGTTVYSLGEVVDVARKSISTGTVVEIKHEWTTTSANDIARIDLGNGCCYERQFKELADDGVTALVSEGGAYGFSSPLTVLGPIYSVADFSAETLTPVRLPLDANSDLEQPSIIDATMSANGARVLLQTVTYIGGTQPEGPALPGGGLVCDQLGRCEPTGELPEDCVDPTGSWWCFGQPLPQQLDQLYLYDTASRHSRAVYSQEIESDLLISTIGISGDGNYAFFVLTAPSCPVGPGPYPLPGPLPECSAPDNSDAGLKRLALYQVNSDVQVQVEDIPSICSDIDAASFSECVHLSLAHNGERVLIGVGQRYVSVLYPTPVECNSLEVDGQRLNCPSTDLNNYFGGTTDLQDPLQNPFFPAPLSSYGWHLTDIPSGHNELTGIFDGQIVRASSAKLSGDASTWAFSSAFDMDANTGEDMSWLAGGAVYADSAGKDVNLAVITYRTRPQPGDSGVRLKTLISNFSSSSANLVVVDFALRNMTNSAAAAPVVNLDYDNCQVHDNTYSGNKSVHLLDGGKLQQDGKLYVLRCAIGLLRAGEMFTLDWQLEGDRGVTWVRSHVEANEADTLQRNNTRWFGVAGRRR